MYVKLIYCYIQYDVKIKLRIKLRIKLSQAFIPYDRLIHKKKFFGFYLTAGRAFKMIKTGERKVAPVAPFYSLLYGRSIGIWLLGILLLWKPDREFTDISLHC